VPLTDVKTPVKVYKDIDTSEETMKSER